MLLQNKYFFTYKTHIKLRWLNKPLIEVLCSEFTTRSRDYYIEALSNGVITINKKIVPPTYKLKDLDLIEHTVHIHEPLPPSIEIIAKEPNFWVVNKPFGIPCHPTGSYFEYSVTKILFKDKTVGCVNRLDMPVSGTLILTFGKSAEIHNLLNEAEKIYIAKVKGDFPNYCEVDKPIGISKSKIHQISETGKPSKTIFEKIIYKDGFSLVKCQPITGRTHQIRIHLKFLGFPILHDILYGDEELEIMSDNPEYTCSENLDEYENKQKYECIIRNCKGANNRTFHIKDKFICLHAWKYTFDGTTYEAKWPEWAYF